MSPVSVVVFNMLSTPALENMSFAGGARERDCEAPVTPETLLALLSRPLKLDTASVKGIVPPLEACVRTSERDCYPKQGNTGAA